MGSSSHSSKRKKKRSQKRSKNRVKSSVDKSKKRKRRHDSDSSCSDDDSLAVLSVSCSSSEGEYRRSRRGRSRDRKDRKVKDRKRRGKRGRSVSESSGDEKDFVKKRKRSRKSKGSESRKKQRGNKRRRGRSISSLSGQSRSSSPCDYSDGSEKEFERKVGKERKGREKRKGRSGSEESRHRSRSCSPCSVRSEGLSSEERGMEENNSRRLKSVIVAAEKGEEAEVREPQFDANKDEFVYEHDDYPSKSNDSNDGVTKREPSSVSHMASFDKPSTLDETVGEAATVNVRASGNKKLDVETSTISSSNISSEVDGKLKGSRDDGRNVNSSSSQNDLEAILRQKALENLLKRQGKVPIKTPLVKKGEIGSEKCSSALKTDPVQRALHDQVIKPVQNVAKVDKTTYVPGALKGIDTPKSTDAPKGTFARVPIGELGTGYRAVMCKARGDHAESRAKIGLTMPRKDFVGGRNTWRRKVISQEASQPCPSLSKEPIDGNSKPQLISQESSQPNLSAPKEAVHIDSNEGSGSLFPQTKKITENLDDVAASELSATARQSSIEKPDGPDDGSGFQQKTMSVMRGGELVEVSYKVYIPKKAPALARRRLNR